MGCYLFHLFRRPAKISSRGRVQPTPVPISKAEPIIEGWLVVFCLLLTVFHPASVLYQMLTSVWPALWKMQDPRHLFLWTVYSIVFLSVGVLGVTTGVKLWAVRPAAVQFAKRFLAIYLCAHLGYFALWILLMYPNSSLSLRSVSLASMIWYHVAGPLPFFFLWTSYLEHSKRVRDTYGSALPSET